MGVGAGAMGGAASHDGAVRGLPPLVSRRAVLAALGFAGPACLVACGAAGPSRPAQVTVAKWVAQRGRHYFVAHRGSGDVYPEHSMPAYQAAYDAGAWCMEVSVCMTLDGVLICMHDLSYDRTTTGRGLIADLPSSVLSSIGIRQPQLGPYWLRPPLPRVPLLMDVLRRFGGRMVLCLEAKDDRAYEPMMRLVDKLRLRDSVIVKAFWTSSRIAEAKAAGFPVFVYVGADQMQEDTLASIAAMLDADHDYLVLPATSGDDVTYYPDRLINGVVSYGVPVWMYPIHRRIDAAHYFALGAAGVMSSSYAYTASSRPLCTADRWSGKRVLPGEMSRHPESGAYAPAWTDGDVLTLGVHDAQQFVTLGQLAPIHSARGSYRITFDGSWPVLPRDVATNLTLAFGHEDDAYYEHQFGRSNGYHAIIRAGGQLQLYQHIAGTRAGTELGGTQTPAPRAGEWMSFQLDVSPHEIRWQRTDVPSAVAHVRDSAWRGGYLHIGRSAVDDRAVAAFRRFRLINR